MKDDFHFLRLWDLYSPLLTATQKEITDLYFNYDLSLGEIAEQKGVSRQSVSDCLNKCRKQLEKYEEKLGFSKILDDLSLEYSAYMTATNRWIEDTEKTCPQWREKLRELKSALNAVQEQFGEETTELETGKVIGKVFREET